MNFCYVCGKPKGTGPCEFCANGGTAREAMTAKTLEQEAREAAEKIIFQSPQPMYQTAIEMSYIAAATARDKENAELRARVAELEGNAPRWARGLERNRLEKLGWLVAGGEMVWHRSPGDVEASWHWLMVPPIQLPEGE